MHCPLRNFVIAAWKYAFRNVSIRVSLAWCEPLLARFEIGIVELQPKVISSAAPGISDEVTASLIEIYRFFSLALGYCFIFYTGGLFFYDLRPVNLNYFHKFFQTVFHMVQIRHTLIFDQAMLPTFECIDEMAPKSVLRFFCTEVF